MVGDHYGRFSKQIVAKLLEGSHHSQKLFLSDSVVYLNCIERTAEELDWIYLLIIAELPHVGISVVSLGVATDTGLAQE